MFQWIQGFTELLLATSNASACDGHFQNELRSHASRLIAALDWIPSDQDSVTFVETYHLTETLFEAAVDARERGCDENVEDIARMLLSWTFKGGRYITGWNVLERGLCGCSALALTGHEGAVDALKAQIGQHLERDAAPDPDVLAHGAGGLRRRTRPGAWPEYTHSRIDDEMAGLDSAVVLPLLDEIADMLSDRPA